MGSRFRCFASTARGVEQCLAGEIEAAGGTGMEIVPAGTRFEGTLEAAYRACLWSRTASRVMIVVASYPAPDGEALYEGAMSVPWEDHVDPARTIAVHATSTRSHLTHTGWIALKTKDAIVDRIRARRGSRPDVDPHDPDLRIDVHLEDDAATVAIDLAGEGLHRRGYRVAGTPAPLKENLAAAVLTLAGWPLAASEGLPLVDPMCGSGTLPIEAALMALDRAPGLGRRRHGSEGWLGHDERLFASLLDEARIRAAASRGAPPIAGYDADRRTVEAARANARRAGVAGAVHLEVLPLAECSPPSRSGVLVVNPPYGKRVGSEEQLGDLYEQIGDVLRRRFTGWTGFVLAGNPALARRIGLRPRRRHALWNGAIECRLLELPVRETAPAAEPAWRRRRSEQRLAAVKDIEAFMNRVTKSERSLRRWASREGVFCYRMYDADLPEYAVAIDRYEDALCVQEYAPPASVDPEAASARLREIVRVLPEVTGVRPGRIFVKVRRRQKGGAQYGKTGDRHELEQVREDRFRFLVNLAEYIDTGLFLDMRGIRRLVGRMARGKRFLNLFAYTATATVHAAGGGASSTTSVDISPAHLEWSRGNLDLNGMHGTQHRLVRADCTRWIETARSAYDLVLLAPPTFSASKRMEGTLDLQRDHGRLIRTVMRILAPGGTIVFVNSFRRFRMDEDLAASFAVENITQRTIPHDFARNPRIHNSWLIRRTS